MGILVTVQLLDTGLIMAQLPNLRCTSDLQKKDGIVCSLACIDIAIFASARTSDEEKELSRATFYKL
jgi:hypothetical protein